MTYSFNKCFVVSLFTSQTNLFQSYWVFDIDFSNFKYLNIYYIREIHNELYYSFFEINVCSLNFTEFSYIFISSRDTYIIFYDVLNFIILFLRSMFVDSNLIEFSYIFVFYNYSNFELIYLILISIQKFSIINQQIMLLCDFTVGL